MKFISYITILGLFPFYFYHIDFIKNNLVSNFNVYYGFIIFGFLLGMQWLRAIEAKRSVAEQTMPIIGVAFVILIINLEIQLKFTAMFGLFFALLNEIFTQGKFLSKNYLLLRFIITILAIYSFFL
tara:strand:+ start:474 stop:851 length:378 start_codon:yes stop_codon:yes gene_type:complete